MEDKRRFPRYENAFEVKYSSQSRTGVDGYSVSTNVSRGGLRLPLSSFIKTGDTLRLRIDPSDSRGNVDAVGRVVWARHVGRPAVLQIDAGVEFTNIDPRNADRLTAGA
jgi:hypothetical protein